MELLYILGIFFSGILIYFLPGYLLNSFLPLKEEEKVILSFAGSLLFYYLYYFLVFLTHSSINLYALFLFLIASFFLLMLKKGKSWNKKAFFPLLLFLLFSLHTFSHQVLTPVYTFGRWFGDWWMHYRLSQFYLYHFPYKTKIFYFSIPTRTHLFNINAAFFLNLWGDTFYKFQIFSTLMNSLFILSFYLLGKKLWGEKRGVFICLILLFLPAIQRNLLYTWPKLLSAYFLFASFYFLLRYEEKERIFYFYLACFLGGLGYFSHPTALVYIFPFILYFAYKRRNALLFLNGFLAFLIPSLPWHIWGVYTFGWKTALISAYPYTKSGNLNPLLNFFSIRIFNSLTTLFPYFFTSAIYKVIEGKAYWLEMYSGLSAFYYGTFPGFFTLTLSIFIWVKRKSLHLPPLRSPRMFFVLSGIIGIIILQFHPAPNGILQTGMLPAALMLLTFLPVDVLEEKRKAFLPFLVLEFSLVIWTGEILIYKLIYSGWIKDANFLLLNEKNLETLFSYVNGKIFWVILGLLIETTAGIFIVKFKGKCKEKK